MVATGFGYDRAVRARQADVLLKLLPRVRDIRRVGAAALDLCWAACGRVDAYYERGVNRLGCGRRRPHRFPRRAGCPGPGRDRRGPGGDRGGAGGADRRAHGADRRVRTVARPRSRGLAAVTVGGVRELAATTKLPPSAAVAQSADAVPSKGTVLRDVWVRVPPAALFPCVVAVGFGLRWLGLRGRWGSRARVGWVVAAPASLLDRDFLLDVPALGERAQREQDEEYLDGDEQHHHRPERIRAQPLASKQRMGRREPCVAPIERARPRQSDPGHQGAIISNRMPNPAAIGSIPRDQRTKT